MYISELRRLIKDEEEKLNRLIYQRNELESFSYTQAEKDTGNIVKPEKSFMDVIVEICAVNKNLRELKKQLRDVNNKTKCDNGKSIDENLFELSQSQAIYKTLQGNLAHKPMTRKSGLKEVEYTALNYKIEELETFLSAVKENINSIQDNIDRANANTIV